MKLKQIIELYRQDWKRVFRNRLTLLLVLALMILPSLYAWFNIAALWDPYANTKDIKVAIYSEDETAAVLDKKVNIGQKIIENLQENDTLDWQFVSSKKELDKGVKSGKYYAGIVMPPDFSTNLVSFVTGNIRKPEIEYSVNEKINAIAPKITDKGAATIQSTITTEFIDTVSQTVFKAMNQVGYDIDSHLVSINKVADKLLYVDEHLDEIDNYTQEVIALNQKMHEYKEKLAQADELKAYLPQVDALGQKVIKLNENQGQIDQAGKMLVTLQEKIPEIENAGRQLKMIDDDFDDIIATLNKTVAQAENGLIIIKDTQDMLPEINRFVVQANQTLPILQADVAKIQETLPQISNGVSTSLQVVVIASQDVFRVTDSLLSFIDENEWTPEQKEEIKLLLNALNEKLVRQDNVISSLIALLSDLQELSGSQNLQSYINHLMRAKEIGAAFQERVGYLYNHIDSLDSEAIKQKLLEIQNFASQLNQTLAVIDVPQLEQHVAELLKNVSVLLDSASQITEGIIDKHLLDSLNRLLDNTTEVIQDALGFFEEYQQELPLIKQEIHDANLLLNNNMQLITKGINTGVNLYQKDYPELKEKLALGANFFASDWPRVKNELIGTVDTINRKIPEIEEALKLTTEFIENDWPDVKNGLHKSAELVRKGEQDLDLSNLIALLKKDAVEESDFLAEPIVLKQHSVYPVPNYGSASAPFYTALCLWVGAVLFSSIATTDVHLETNQKNKFSLRAQFFARMLTFLTVALFQALIVSIGNMWLLKTYVVNPVWSVLFAVLVGLVFMTLVYVLVGLFGNLGKGLAVIILVLSISGGGGNFPIEMSGPFFRMIHPLLPFTYAVNLLRESTGGIYWPNAGRDIGILFMFGLIFTVAGYFLLPLVKNVMKHLNEQLKEGHLLH
nr:YhgE/Pip domain-containing protein [Vagococcus elongatus]